MAIAESNALLYVQMSVTTHVPLTTIPAEATYVVIVPESAIRWRDDGTAATASVGMPVAAGATLVYDGKLSSLDVVSQSGTAVVNVSYYAARNR